jgi:hypothetical protein
MSLVGTFEIKSGRIAVSDPCYGGDKEFPAKKGKWLASVKMSDEGSWGMRVARLMAHHEDHPVGGCRDLGDSVGVDSGQMSISDAEICPALAHGLYDEVCQKTAPAGIVACGLGVASSSGYGDGGYALLIAKDGDLVVGAEVVFIPDKQTCPACGVSFTPSESDITLCDDCYAVEDSGYCEGCGNLTPNPEMRDGLCEDCFESWAEAHTCDICGCVVEDSSDLTDGQCEHCYAEHKISG